VTLKQDIPVTHIVVGTKAQFIKMAPIARLLQERGWPYRILDLGQHGSITPGIVRDFDLRPDHVHVLPGGSTVATYPQAFRWVRALLARIATPRRRLTSELVARPAGYALVHGDTLSTLLGLYLARRIGLQVALVEAGLSSSRMFDPFPEELIRRHVEKRADMLFAPDSNSASRLEKRGLRGKVVDTGYNTGRDALLIMAGLQSSRDQASCDFQAVLTIHRAETIGRATRLRAVIHHVIDLAPRIGPVRFFLHEPTRRALIRAGLLGELEGSCHFQLRPLGPYPEFTAALVRAKFILTDGGSIQEEASYLNKRCLILRRATEREHGLGTTAMLTTLDIDTDLRFLFRDPEDDVAWDSHKLTFEAPKTIIASLYPQIPS
jgi:UDP-N-acetylglucosamine 2-epimerase (non-hydrolysing)